MSLRGLRMKELHSRLTRPIIMRDEFVKLFTANHSANIAWNVRYLSSFNCEYLM